MGRTDRKMWEHYEELREIVYVVDMDSHELVYMNRWTRKLCGVKAEEEIKGRKCYEVLMGSSVPCAVCGSEKLSPGKFTEEIRYNPVIKKKLALKDTVIEEDGKRYRFELAVDLTACEQQDRGYEDNEAMVNEGLRLSLAASNPEKSIAVLIEYLGQSLNSERAYIFEQKEDGSFDNTYEWCASGVLPQKENLQGVLSEMMEPWRRKFVKGENVVIRDLDKIRESEKGIYECLRLQGIRSLVVSPLVLENKIIGFYGVDNPPEIFLEHTMNLLQILGHFIVALFHRRNHVRRLEALCYQDQLTGLGNRHAMNEYITGRQAQKSIGVLYCDVMGLKRTNDKKGHQEGDCLLIRASQCLQNALGDYALFRIGGDEFLALCEGIGEEEWKARIESLKEKMAEKKSWMALGHIWHEDGRRDMVQLLKEADALMYEDKRAWYAKAPGDGYVF